MMRTCAPFPSLVAYREAFLRFPEVVLIVARTLGSHSHSMRVMISGDPGLTAVDERTRKSLSSCETMRAVLASMCGPSATPPTKKLLLLAIAPWKGSEVFWPRSASNQLRRQIHGESLVSTIFGP